MKTNESNLRKWMKPNSGPILAPSTQFGSQKYFSCILPLLDVRHCYKLSFYEISRETNEPNLRKW